MSHRRPSRGRGIWQRLEHLEERQRWLPEPLTHGADAELARLSDAELEMLVLSGRPEVADAFRERADPATWPEWSAWSDEERALLADEYAHWRLSPETFLTQIDPPTVLHRR